MAKIDIKKDQKQYYNPSKKPHIIEIPTMKYYMVDGWGSPGNTDYINAVESLYGVSYTLKMALNKKNRPEMDYVVPPLEGLWYMDNMDEWSMENKDAWKWTMMIRIPDFIPPDEIIEAIELAKAKKKLTSIDKLYADSLNEDICVQMLHIGSYDEEESNIRNMHSLAAEMGYGLHKKHHEIYLNDPRKTDPQKLRTVLRQPIVKN